MKIQIVFIVDKTKYNNDKIIYIKTWPITESTIEKYAALSIVIMIKFNGNKTADHEYLYWNQGAFLMI